MDIQRLQISSYAHIFILTGAGISAASGLRTFRGANGMLDDDAMWASDARFLPENLPALWRLYGGLRSEALQVQPNTAHTAIAALQRRWAGQVEITLATQNVDGLHQKAGSPQVIELHGSALRSRCLNAACSLPAFVDNSTPGDVPPTCPQCGAPLRPDIVMFSEALPIEALRQVSRALEHCDLFLAVGTSGVVYPAAGFVQAAAQAGAHTLLVNLEAMQPRNPYFDKEILGPAEIILPFLLDVT